VVIEIFGSLLFLFLLLLLLLLGLPRLIFLLNVEFKTVTQVPILFAIGS
jgi:hypothetical protein